MTKTNQKWTRQKGERSKAFHYFTIYRNLGPTRSLEQVHRKCRKGEGEEAEDTISQRQLERLSSQNDWVERAEAYDDYIDQKQVEKNIKEIEAMNERQAEDAVEIQKQALNDYHNVCEDGLSKAAIENRKNSAARTWEIGARNERLARGAATEKVEQSGTIKQRHTGNIGMDSSKFDKEIQDKILDEEGYDPE